MYSPIKQNLEVRVLANNKKKIIKGRRIIKQEKTYYSPLNSK